MQELQSMPMTAKAPWPMEPLQPLGPVQLFDSELAQVLALNQPLPGASSAQPRGSASPAPRAQLRGWAEDLVMHDMALMDMELSMGALLRFRSMMAQDGHTVQMPRMCFDRRYAYSQLALAHTSAHDKLRRLALELFQTFLRRDEWRDVER